MMKQRFEHFCLISVFIFVGLCSAQRSVALPTDSFKPASSTMTLEVSS